MKAFSMYIFSGTVESSDDLVGDQARQNKEKC